jgi:hypothetical protein
MHICPQLTVERLSNGGSALGVASMSEEEDTLVHAKSTSICPERSQRYCQLSMWQCYLVLGLQSFISRYTFTIYNPRTQLALTSIFVKKPYVAFYEPLVALQAVLEPDAITATTRRSGGSRTILRRTGHRRD